MNLNSFRFIHGISWFIVTITIFRYKRLNGQNLIFASYDIYIYIYIYIKMKLRAVQKKIIFLLSLFQKFVLIKRCNFKRFFFHKSWKIVVNNLKDINEKAVKKAQIMKDVSIVE